MKRGFIVLLLLFLTSFAITTTASFFNSGAWGEWLSGYAIDDDIKEPEPPLACSAFRPCPEGFSCQRGLCKGKPETQPAATTPRVSAQPTLPCTLVGIEDMQEVGRLKKTLQAVPKSCTGYCTEGTTPFSKKYTQATRARCDTPLSTYAPLPKRENNIVGKNLYLCCQASTAAAPPTPTPTTQPPPQTTPQAGSTDLQIGAICTRNDQCQTKYCVMHSDSKARCATAPTPAPSTASKACSLKPNCPVGLQCDTSNDCFSKKCVNNYCVYKSPGETCTPGSTTEQCQYGCGSDGKCKSTTTSTAAPAPSAPAPTEALTIRNSLVLPSNRYDLTGIFDNALVYGISNQKTLASCKIWSTTPGARYNSPNNALTLTINPANIYPVTRIPNTQTGITIYYPHSGGYTNVGAPAPDLAKYGYDLGIIAKNRGELEASFTAREFLPKLTLVPQCTSTTGATAEQQIPIWT